MHNPAIGPKQTTVGSTTEIWIIEQNTNTTTWTFRYGGGLDMPDLRTKIGIAQLKLLRNAVVANTEVGKMILISLKYTQIESGILQRSHLKEHPGIFLPAYITPTWLMSMRQYLYQHKPDSNIY